MTVLNLIVRQTARDVMLQFKINEKFLETSFGSRANSLPGSLMAVIVAGFVQKDDCVFLRALYNGASAKTNSFPDNTGLECFVNHIHIEDYSPDSFFEAGLEFLRAIRHSLKLEFPDIPFRCIISVDEDGCNIRFHRIRAGYYSNKSLCVPVLTKYNIFETRSIS
jgi:hypothetical protein